MARRRAANARPRHAVVFLIDDDKPQIIHWCQDRRASADEYALFAAAQAAPGIVALSGRKLAVEYGDFLAEVLFEPPYHLPGQGNFGDQDYRTAIRCKRQGH